MTSVYDDLTARYGPVMRTCDVAAVLGMSATHARALLRAGALPGVRIGERWVVPTAKLAAMFDGGRDV